MNVSGPAIPSAARPFFACQSFRAFSVAGPKTASASTPGLPCSLFTGSPERPFLRIAMAAPRRGELLARQFRLQKADDQGRNAATDASRQERGNDRANVEPGIWPPTPPPRAPAMELPRGPRLRSLATFPTALPPSAPAISCMMSAVRFIASLQRSPARVAYHHWGASAQ